MPSTKVTLSADGKLVEKAKRLAAARKTSVSALFDRFLQATVGVQGAKQESLGPLTQRALGLVRRPPRGKSDRDLLVSALQEKYGLKR